MNNNRKKILLTSNAYYPSIGGIENSLRHLAEEAKNAGDDVTILVSDIAVAENVKNRFKDTVNGVEVFRYPMYPIKNKMLKIFNIIASNWLLYKKLKSEYTKNPHTIVIARFHFSAVLAYLAGFENVRYLVPSIVRNQLNVESNIGLFRIIKNRFKIILHDIFQKKALRCSKNYVFSRNMISQCVALAKNKEANYILTKPGVDSSRFYPLDLQRKNNQKTALGFSISSPIVLFVGRFVKAKGGDVLIKAFSMITEDCHLLMIGDGIEKDNYLKLIDHYGLKNRVTILSPTTEVEQFYQIADVFAMTSNYEPLGQTILEALASGLQIVSFKNSDKVLTATQELNIDQAVTYAEEYDVPSLSEAIKIALTLSKYHSYDRAKLANEKFNWSKLYGCLVND